MNTLFVGDADPRLIRAALLLLPDGDRSAFGFPNAFPFNCTWHDPVDPTPQTTYVVGAGWLGSTVQLTCGDIETLRFHIRLFGAGAWSIGGAHFEVRIPGTPNHDVLSWELSEALIKIDFIRAGIVNPLTDVASSGPINQAPVFRTTLPQIYNAVAPLWPILGTPGPVTDAVPIPTDGQATILRISGGPGAEPVRLRREYVVQFGQVVPKPFCVTGAPTEYLYVSGPVR